MHGLVHDRQVDPDKTEVFSGQLEIQLVPDKYFPFLQEEHLYVSPEHVKQSPVHIWQVVGNVDVKVYPLTQVSEQDVPCKTFPEGQLVHLS
jgi:hypothetical protein